MRTSALDAGLISCRHCLKLAPLGQKTCTLCYAHLHPRKPLSLQKVWALWTASIIAYIPANLYPIMVTRTLYDEKSSTIVSGIFQLFGHGSYFVASIILLVSVVIPVVKFILVAWLALSVQFDWVKERRNRHIAYELVEKIGRWSMVDVFVVAVLAALIQLDSLMSIQPGIGVNSFALAVVLSMLAAESFDSRLIWDRTGDNNAK